MSRWIHFNEVRDTGKTKTWEVRSIQGNFLLGHVSWHGPWRQYTFTPNILDVTIWNAECLNDLAAFMKEQMDVRKVSRAANVG